MHLLATIHAVFSLNLVVEKHVCGGELNSLEVLTKLMGILITVKILKGPNVAQAINIQLANVIITQLEATRVVFLTPQDHPVANGGAQLLVAKNP